MWVCMCVSVSSSVSLGGCAFTVRGSCQCDMWSILLFVTMASTGSDCMWTTSIRRVRRTDVACNSSARLYGRLDLFFAHDGSMTACLCVCPPLPMSCHPVTTPGILRRAAQVLMHSLRIPLSVCMSLFPRSCWTPRPRRNARSSAASRRPSAANASSTTSAPSAAPATLPSPRGTVGVAGAAAPAAGATRVGRQAAAAAVGAVAGVGLACMPGSHAGSVMKFSGCMQGTCQRRAAVAVWLLVDGCI